MKLKEKKEKESNDRMKDAPVLYTTNEAAEILKTTRYTIMTMIKNGQLKAKKFGNQWRIPKSELEF